MLDEVLNTAEDLVIIGKSGTKGKYVFAFPLKGEVAKHYFYKTLADGEERNVAGFKEYWQFDDKTGLITGSSTFLALRLDEAVRADGFWIPDIEEALFLDKERRLTNGVYRDYGLAVFNDREPNQEVANEIISKSGNRELPLIIPFKDVAHRLDGNFPYGVAISLVDNPSGLKSGEQAQKILSRFNYVGDSGACRVYRYRYSGWFAGLDGLGGSGSGGRGDFLCGEATRADLLSAHDGLLKRRYDAKLFELAKEEKRLLAQQDKEQMSFLEQIGM
ncbi:MAG: hypothetical protein WC533_00625 [Candidatus Pacearchaeota archaeon]